MSLILQGRLIGADGKALSGEFVLIDAQSNMLSQVFKTASDGSYSFTVGWPSESEWVNFYAPGYHSTVFTTMEVYEQPELLLQVDPSQKQNNNLLPITLAATAALLLLNKKKKVGKITTGEVMPYIAIGAGVLGFSFFKQFLEKLGIWDSKDTKDLDADATNPANAWSPAFYHNKPDSTPWTYRITDSTAAAYSREIYNAFGPFNDCEECAKAVIKRLRTKSNLSFLAEVFSSIYGQDLLSFLRGGNWPQDRLSDADVNEINQYVKNLPNY